MTEMITIIAVGVGLAGLILNGQKNAREDTKSLEARLREGMNARFDQMCSNIEDLEAAGFVNRGGKGSHRKFVHSKVSKSVWFLADC